MRDVPLVFKARELVKIEKIENLKNLESLNLFFFLGKTGRIGSKIGSDRVRVRIWPESGSGQPESDLWIGSG